MTALFHAQPGRFYDSVEAAQYAIEVFPTRFPTGYCYMIEPRYVRCDRGIVITMATICAYSDAGLFIGYCPCPEE